MKTHWKMFLCGGLLKLLGDLTALVGPISITQIVEYIRLNLSASSLTLMPIVSPDQSTHSAKLFVSNGTFTRSNIANGVNDIIKIISTINYNSPLSDAATASLPSESGRTMSAPLINENTEIYYPNWMDFVENGWIMALLVLFSTLAQGTFSQASTHIVNMIGIRLRTSLQSLVYRKTLLISSSCFVPDSSDGCGAATSLNDNNDNSNGSISLDPNEPYANRYANNEIVMNGIDDDNGSNENDDKTKTDSNSNATIDKTAHQPFNESTAIDTGTITNLMSEDALNVMSFFWIAHYVWAIPLKVCLINLMFLFNVRQVCIHRIQNG